MAAAVDRAVDRTVDVAAALGDTAAVTTTPQLRALTGLRFVAALHVALYHALRPVLVDVDGAGNPLLTFIANGPAAVTLFFVLSGFVLVQSVGAAGHLDGEQRRVPWRAFIAARLARIAPVYLLALAVVVPLGLAARHRGLVDDPLGPLSFVLVAAGLQAFVPEAALRWNPPAWSVSAELFFYVCFPVVVVVLARWTTTARSRFAQTLWLLGLLAPLAYLYLDPDHLTWPKPGDEGFWLHLVQFNPLLRLPEFVVGVVAGLLWRRGGAIPAQLRGPVVVVAIVGSVVVASIAGVPRLLLHNGLLAPAYAALIVALSYGEGAVARVLSSSPLQRLGEASYALYLLHVPLLMWAMALTKTSAAKGLSPTVAVVVVVLAAIPLSLLVERVVERPARRFLRARLMSTSAEA